MKGLLDRIGAFWGSLSRRDRRLLTIMVVAVTLFAGYFVVTGVRNRVDKLEESVGNKERDLASIERMQGSLAENRAQITQLEDQLEQYENFSVSGFLESTGDEIKISEQIKGINDQGVTEGTYFDQHRYEVVLKQVTLEQVINYLYKVQSAPQPLNVDRLVIRTNTRNREELNANIEVIFSTLPKEG